jgi:hypothetical protein
MIHIQESLRAPSTAIRMIASFMRNFSHLSYSFDGERLVSKLRLWSDVHCTASVCMPQTMLPQNEEKALQLSGEGPRDLEGKQASQEIGF